MDLALRPPQPEEDGPEVRPLETRSRGVRGHSGRAGLPDGRPLPGQGPRRQEPRGLPGTHQGTSAPPRHLCHSRPNPSRPQGADGDEARDLQAEAAPRGAGRCASVEHMREARTVTRRPRARSAAARGQGAGNDGKLRVKRGGEGSEPIRLGTTKKPLGVLGVRFTRAADAVKEVPAILYSCSGSRSDCSWPPRCRSASSRAPAWPRSSRTGARSWRWRARSLLPRSRSSTRSRRLDLSERRARARRRAARAPASRSGGRARG